MSVAHLKKDIPMIPGLPIHPIQLTERKRLAMLKRQESDVIVSHENSVDKNYSLSKRTLNILKRLNRDLKSADGTSMEVAPLTSSNFRANYDLNKYTKTSS